MALKFVGAFLIHLLASLCARCRLSFMFDYDFLFFEEDSGGGAVSVLFDMLATAPVPVCRVLKTRDTGPSESHKAPTNPPAWCHAQNR